MRHKRKWCRFCCKYTRYSIAFLGFKVDSTGEIVILENFPKLKRRAVLTLCISCAREFEADVYKIIEKSLLGIKNCP